jgi:hypothetical protein
MEPFDCLALLLPVPLLSWRWCCGCCCCCEPPLKLRRCCELPTFSVEETNATHQRLGS